MQRAARAAQHDGYHICALVIMHWTKTPQGHQKTHSSLAYRPVTT